MSFVIPLLLYLGIHLILRLLVSQSIGYDEAEQVVWSQTLAWGYGPQPPLYTWLLWLLVQIFGLNLFTLALLKMTVLGGMYLFLFLSARRLLGDAYRASLTAFSLLLVPLIAWGSLKGSTHSDLLCVVCLATFWGILQLVETGWLRYYLLLGVLAGLGMLCKYNYALFLATLLAAGLTIAAYRPRLLDRRLLMAWGVAFLIVLPHALWVLEHGEMVRGYLVAKLTEGRQQTYLGGVAGGIRSLLYRSWCLLTGPVLAWMVCFPHVWRPAQLLQPARSDAERLLLRFLAGAVVVLLLLIVAGTNQFLPRWLTPFLVLVPIGFFIRPAAQTLSTWQLRRYGRLLLAAAVSLMLFRTGQVWWGSPAGGYYRARDLSFARQVRQIEAAGFRDGLIIAHDSLTGANLRLFFPQARLLCTNYPACRVPLPEDSPCLIVWNAGASDMTPDLEGYLAPHGPSGWSHEEACRLAQELKTGGHRTPSIPLIRLP